VGLALSREARHGRVTHMVALVLSTVALGASTLMTGPFILVPAVAVANAMSYSMHPGRIPRWVSIGIGSLAFVVPVGLELVGLLPPSFEFVDGAMRILPRMTWFPRGATLTYFVLANLATIVVASLYAARFHAKLGEIEQRLHLHAWQLRQLVPEEASEAVKPR